MEKRRIGDSGLYITPIGFGAWGIGGPPFWVERDESVSIRAIHMALDKGLNFIDTAPVYGFGLSEKVVGKAISGRRDEVVLATKCGLRWTSESLKGINYCLAPASIIEEVHQSLARLKTDRIDLYQVHWPDPKTPLEQTMVTLSALKAQGKIRYIGVSNFSVEQMEQALEIVPVVSLQSKYNLLERDIESTELPFCRERNIGVLAYSPLASGLLTGKYSAGSTFDGWRKHGKFGLFGKKTLGPALEKVRKLKEITDKTGVPLTHMAIRWVIDQPGVTCSIVGANTPEQVEDNIGAMDLALSETDYSETLRALEN